MNINDDIAANLSRFLNERNISASAAAKSAELPQAP